jgi:hypothetical protein
VQMAGPPVEALLGAWLLSLRAPRAAAAAAVVLAGGFAGALLTAMRRGVAAPCRCFGALDRGQPHRVSLARALLLLAAAATASAGGAGSGDGAGVAAAWSLGVVLAVCAVVGFALVAEVAAFRAGVRRVLAGAGAREQNGGLGR